MDSIIFIFIILIFTLFLLFVYICFSRIRLPRKQGFEGIEDPEAAHAYDRISRWPQFRMLRHLIVGKLVRHNLQGTLVDVGCGPGLLLMLIARKFPMLNVVGIDSSNEMIRTAASNAARLGLSGRIGFREGDVVSIPFEDNTVDYVISTLSLHHWAYPEKGLAEIFRVLKVDGKFFLFDLRRDPRRIFYLLLRFAQAVVVPGPLKRVREPLGSLLASYTESELGALFEKSLFGDWNIEGGPGWAFTVAKKQSRIDA